MSLLDKTIADLFKDTVNGAKNVFNTLTHTSPKQAANEVKVVSKKATTKVEELIQGFKEGRAGKRNLTPADVQAVAEVLATKMMQAE